MSRCSFTVVHPHIHKQRPRVLRSGRAYTPKQTVEAEGAVQSAFCKAFWEIPSKNRWFSDSTLKMTIFAEIQIPKSRRDLNEAQPHTQKPDCDNIAKLVMDALNGVAYQDDSQVYSLEVIKRWTTAPTQIGITIEEYE